jgi:DNA polymerase III alpha subunit
MRITDLKPADIHVQGWLQTRFGDHQAQVSTSTKLRLRSSVKDVARALHGFVSDDIERLTKRMTKPPQGVEDYDFIFGYEDSGNHVQGSIETDSALQEYVAKYPRDWEIVQKCLGLQRQRGKHACAFIIANRPIAEFLPMEEVGGSMVTQYDKDDAEAAGGLKMDFLVVNTLNDIAAAIKLVQERSGLPIPDSMVIHGKQVPGIRLVPLNGQLHDIWDLPEDQGVFHDVCEGRTETVFQFNTQGAQDWLKHFNYWRDKEAGRKAIDSVEAMSAFTALDRPGPLDAYVEKDGKKHNMLVEYARRARGEEAIGALPIFMEMLPETYGVLTYQEQLQRMYQQLTGCSGPDAEEFRSNVAKKKMEKILKAFEPWMEKVGAKLGKETAREVWDMFVSWGQYGFNKSHAVCYAHIAYASAFLKHHYQLEWWTAVLRNATKDDISNKFWKFCGHLIDFPEISTSGPTFEIVDGRIRAPISLLNGIGEKAHNQLLAYRPYADINDFCRKIKKHSDDTSKVKLDKEGKPVVKTKMVKLPGSKTKVEHQVIVKTPGSNALNRGVCYNLIVSGVFDSLFPGDLQVVQKLSAFETALATAKGVKVEAIKPHYRSLSPIKRYQMRKQVLPAYSQPLMEMVAEAEDGHRLIKKRGQGGKIIPQWPHGIGVVSFRPPAAVRIIDELDFLPNGQSLYVAMPAYVQTQRVFSFQGTKEACEFILDVDGEHMKYVMWPSYDGDGTIADKYKQPLEGAVVVAIVCKSKEDRPTRLEELYVVQLPLDEAKKAEEEDLLSQEQEQKDGEDAPAKPKRRRKAASESGGKKPAGVPEHKEDSGRESGPSPNAVAAGA